MEKDYPRSLRETFDATMEAARNLNLKISSEQFTPSESKILASTQDGTDVKVELVARPNEITTVKIRFGMMGQRRLVGLLPPPDHEDFAHPGPAVKTRADNEAADRRGQVPGPPRTSFMKSTGPERATSGPVH